MAQFDVYANLNRQTQAATPYLLDVQTELLDSLSTRVVVPLLVTAQAGIPITRLNPVFEIEGTQVMMSTPELAGVPHGVLGPVVLSLSAHRAEVIGALDLLFTGA